MVFRTPASGVFEAGGDRKPRALDRVRLREALREGGADYPAGAEGTVVHRYKNGAALEVEFTEPVAGVITIEPSKLQVVEAAPRKRPSA